MSEDQLTRLFVFMEGRFNRLEAQLETKADKSQIDTILNMIDGIIGRQDTAEVEMAAMRSQLDRHDARLDGIDSILKQHTVRLDTIDDKLTKHTVRLDDIDGRLKKQGAQFNTLDQRLVHAGL